MKFDSKAFLLSCKTPGGALELSHPTRNTSITPSTRERIEMGFRMFLLLGTSQWLATRNYSRQDETLAFSGWSLASKIAKKANCEREKRQVALEIRTPRGTAA
jgi:hypothetical protein